MLSKLLKKDFHSTCRFFLPLLCGYAVAAIVGKIMFEIVLSESHISYNSSFFNGITLFYILYMVIFFIYLIACYLMTSVFVVYDFYKTMVSDHGYLTHTLPVKTNSLIWSKVWISIFWQILVNILIALSVLLFFTGHLRNIPIMNILESFISKFDSQFGTYLFYIIVNIIIELFKEPLTFFCCIAIGQLWKEHRVMGAILAYIGIYIVTRILSTIFLVLIGGGSIFYSATRIFYHGYMTFSALFGLITTVIFFFITSHILSNKLNLE